MKFVGRFCETPIAQASDTDALQFAFMIARFPSEKTGRLGMASPSGGRQDARRPHRQDVCATSVRAPEELLC
jgi:hypothetical protein